MRYVVYVGIALLFSACRVASTSIERRNEQVVAVGTAETEYLTERRLTVKRESEFFHLEYQERVIESNSRKIEASADAYQISTSRFRVGQGTGVGALWPLDAIALGCAIVWPEWRSERFLGRQSVVNIVRTSSPGEWRSANVRMFVRDVLDDKTIRAFRSPSSQNVIASSQFQEFCSGRQEGAFYVAVEDGRGRILGESLSIPCNVILATSFRGISYILTSGRP